MNYRVLYTSVGLLSGKQAGDTVTIHDQRDAAHLTGLGLIAPVVEPKEGEDGKPGKRATRKPADD